MSAQVGALRVNLDLNSANFTQGIQSINRQLRGLNSEMNAARAGNREFDNSLDGMRQRQENLSRAFQAQQQRTGMLRAEYDRLSQTYGQNSSQAQQMLTRYNNSLATMNRTQSTLQSLNGRIAEAENRWLQLSRRVGEAGERIQSVGGKMKDVGSGLTTGVTAPIVGLGAAALKTASDFDASAGKIQAQLGLTAKQSEELSETAKNLWKQGFGENIEEASDAVAKVYQNLGNLPADEIEKVTASAFTLSKTFDADVNETTRAAAQLMQQFGIDSNEAMDMLTVAFQRGGDYSGELLDSVSEYSTQFANMGFSAEQMMGMFASGAESGIFSLDKLGDAVKESFLQITDGADGTRESLSELGLDYKQIESDMAKGGEKANAAFGVVMTAIAGVTDEADRNRLAVELMGTPIEDLGPQYQSFFANVGEGMTDFKGAAEEATKAVQDNFGTRLSSVWRSAQEALLPLGNVLLDMAETVLPKVESVITKVSEKFENMSSASQQLTVGFGLIFAAIGPVLIVLGTLIGAIGSIITAVAPAINVLSKLKPVFTGIRVAMVALTGPIGLIGIAVAGLAYLIYKNWDGVVKYTKIAFDSVKKYLSEVWERVKADWNTLKSFFTVTVPDLAKKFAGWFLGIKDDAVAKFEELKKKTSEKFEQLKAFFIKIIPLIVAAILGPIGLMALAIYKNWDEIKKKTESIFNTIKSLLNKIWETAKNEITTRVNNLRTNIETAFTNAKSKVESLMSALKTALMNVFNSIRTEITNRVNGVKDNIIGAFTTAKTKVESLVGNIKSATTKLWDDIVGGAKALPKRISDGISAMAGGVMTGVNKMVNKLASGIGKGINGAIDGINWVLGKINVDKIDKWKVPTYEKGTNNHPGGLAMVNDFPGSNYQELIRTPDGKIGMAQGRNQLLNLPKGTTVLSGDKTSQLLSSIPRYKNGIGDLIGDAAGLVKKGLSKAKNFALDIWDYIDKPSEMMGKVWNNFIPDMGLKGTFGNIAKGGMKLIKGKALDWIKNQMPVLNYNFGAPFHRTSGYGPRWGTLHKGVDWAAPTGTPIKAVAGGKVISADFGVSGSGFGGYGNYIYVKGAGGLTYLYAHNSKNLVKAGDTIGRGDTIGLVGSTGDSTGPHVHFEVRKNGTAINPDLLGGGIGNLGGKFSGSGAEMAKNAITQALQMLGKPMSLLQPLMTIAKKESGFNPNAINDWDINAKRGDPSVGLFQIINSTFQRWKMSGYNDRRNPLDSALAAIRYMDGRYGGVMNHPGIKSMLKGGGYKPYANGGIITRPHLGLVGEAGAEGIIPLSLNKRGIALDLWEKIGGMIGAFDMGGVNIPSFNSGNVPSSNTSNTQNINVVLNYSGNVSQSDVMHMVDLVENELSKRTNLRMMAQGV